MKTSNNEIKITSSGVERRNLVNKINLLDEKEIVAVVLGLPLQMNGNLVELAAEVRKFASFLEENF